MTDLKPYSDAFTERERRLGFELLAVANPHSGFAFEADKVQAVVLRLGPSDRIIKLNNPLTGQTEYQHQCYGTYTPATEPDWKAVQAAFPAPEDAIQSWRNGRDNQDEEAMSTRVLPCEPGDRY